MTDRLSRFTPNAAGLDRDAILFAAGRQSRRGHRAWPVIAGLLAISQAATLLFLWPTSPSAMEPDKIAPVVRPTPDLELPAASPLPSMLTAGSRTEPELNHASMNDEYVSSGPTLTAGSAFRLD